MSDYSTHQRTAILLMKTGGVLSMIASNFIMRDVFIRYHTGERLRLTHRIVFEMSLANFWGTFFSAFMSTWMTPKESGYCQPNGATAYQSDYEAAGTTASCTTQGFFDSFFSGWSVLMNAILALSYFLIVKYGMKDEAQSRRSLALILGAPPLFCFLLATKPLFDQAYNYTDFHICGVAEYPLGCLNENYNCECTRGLNAREFKIARFACVCLANLVIVVSVGILIRHIMQRERSMTTANMQNNDMIESTRKVTWQGIWYVLAFFFSWGPWYVWQWVRITSEMITMATHDSPALLYLISITHPLQGVGNALVYFRPKYLKFRERDSEELRIASLFRTLDLPVPKCLAYSANDFDVDCNDGNTI